MTGLFSKIYILNENLSTSHKTNFYDFTDSRRTTVPSGEC